MSRLKTKSIIIASDHAGFDLKEELKKYLLKKHFKLKDLGTHSRESCDYPLFAYELAKQISRSRYDRGILICKTGIGNSIVANKLPGVRAALCYNIRAAKATRQHNDSNVLVLGSAFVNKKTALKILDTWLNTEFEGGRHARRLKQIEDIERRIGAKAR